MGAKHLTGWAMHTALGCLLLYHLPLLAQDHLLSRKIDLEARSETLDGVLQKIEEAGHFSFAYNAALIDDKQQVSLSLLQVPVREVLDTLFGRQIAYKVRGNYVILSAKQPVLARKPEKEKKTRYQISGYIVDAITGEKIKNASVYELSEHHSVLTDEQGFYSLIVSSRQQFLELSFSKSEYLDTVIVIKPVSDQSINIPLNKIPEVTEPLEAITLTPDLPLPSPVDSLPIVRFMVARDMITQVENLNFYHEQPAQFSFLPLIGTNQKVSGLTINKISVNMIAGYAAGVKGMEVGGVLNIVRTDVSGFQAAGLGNLVGGNTRGMQIAGFFNNNLGSLKGLQAAGFNNVVLDSLNGVQLAGFNNVLKGPLKGLQVAGFNNIATQDVTGVQMAGFSNFARGNIKRWQVSGFFNFSHGVEGVQLSGFANWAAGDLEGIQVSGFFNKARAVSGMQLGFINVSDTLEKGVTLGFFNYILKGYHQFELAATESLLGHVAFRTGSRKVYNIFAFGLRPEQNFFPIKAYGYGLGTLIKLGKNLDLPIEGLSYGVLDEEKDTDIMMMSSLSTCLSVKLSRHLRLNAGPSLNMQLMRVAENYDGALPNGLAIEPFTDDFIGPRTNIKLWAGGKIGLGFTW